MKITENEHYIQVESSDCNGDFFFRICKNRTMQIRLETESGDNYSYANVDKEELTAIRDCINKILEL